MVLTKLRCRLQVSLRLDNDGQSQMELHDGANENLAKVNLTQE